MSDSRPLPGGWIAQFDANHNRTFYVNTRTNPPQSSWVHPIDDPIYLTASRNSFQGSIHEPASGWQPPSQGPSPSLLNDRQSDYFQRSPQTMQQVRNNEPVILGYTSGFNHPRNSLGLPTKAPWVKQPIYQVQEPMYVQQPPNQYGNSGKLQKPQNHTAAAAGGAAGGGFLGALCCLSQPDNSGDWAPQVDYGNGNVHHSGPHIGGHGGHDSSGHGGGHDGGGGNDSGGGDGGGGGDSGGGDGGGGGD